ncbi:MAG: stage IV sporulation protein A, partial [Clostridia bacterium]|nr:stage IV sporulation protein A [Clostridia bacterium]
MEVFDIYEDIAKRTAGDIYVGVVGPVRSGKSTLVKKLTERLILPNISDKNKKKIALDETPQTAGGKAVMTTEPKFVPGEAVSVKIDKAKAKIKLIDCVGYMVDGAFFADEEGKPRMVKTPWDDEEMPFDKAAEI